MTSKVFIVEDEGLIALELEKCLEQAGFRVVGIADNADDALVDIAGHHPDVILMDIRIKGDRDGIWAAGEIRRRLDLPVVFVTAHGDDETLERARNAEPYNFLVKPFMNVNFRAQLQTVIWKHATEAALRAERAWLASTLNHVSGAILATDAHGNVTYLNAEAERLTGYTTSEAKGLSLLEIFAIYDDVTGLPIVSPIHAVHQGRDVSPEMRNYHLSSERTQGVVVVEASVSVNRDEAGLVGLIAAFRDVTEERASEARARQKERLEAVQALANGLGQDLKAMLGTLVEHVEKLCHRVPEDLQELAQATQHMGKECQAWVAQLNELGVQELPFTEPVDVNQIVREVVRDPQTALLGAWSCTLDLAEGGTRVLTHVESCRQNLARTLREMRRAMPRGGSVRISTWARDNEVVVCLRDDQRKSLLKVAAPNRVFDPYRFPPDGVRRSNGLALTLLHHFMGLSGGTIECSGDGPGENLVLTLHFPTAGQAGSWGRGTAARAVGV